MLSGGSSSSRGSSCSRHSMHLLYCCSQCAYACYGMQNAGQCLHFLTPLLVPMPAASHPSLGACCCCSPHLMPVPAASNPPLGACCCSPLLMPVPAASHPRQGPARSYCLPHVLQSPADAYCCRPPPNHRAAAARKELQQGAPRGGVRRGMQPQALTRPWWQTPQQR